MIHYLHIMLLSHAVFLPLQTESVEEPVEEDDKTEEDKSDEDKSDDDDATVEEEDKPKTKKVSNE